MKIGLFFGSFNPIHLGHMVIANYMANHTELDKVWLILSPHNPLKDKKLLIQVYDRLEMAKLATENCENIEVKDDELKLPKPSYTVDTLVYLQEKYPNITFVLIMGQDNLLSLPKWKNYEFILKHYLIYVYPRLGVSVSALSLHPSVTITNTPLMEISSSFIRKAIHEGKNVQFFIPDKVLNFIESKSLYR
ncbi:MAG: nicotinate-nucleotide adenylyltransferase [Sphingobacteriales bacterium]|nr:MAG: nicotinate-nucleotide adenylyltransferase [Sphingobacteriales bacterium]